MNIRLHDAVSVILSFSAGTAFTACGGSVAPSDATTDASLLPDVAAPVSPWSVGALTAGELSLRANFVSAGSPVQPEWSVYFFRPPAAPAGNPPPCRYRVEDACRVLACDGAPHDADSVNAGTLTISGGTGNPLVAAPDANGRYLGMYPSPPMYAAGDSIELSATGGVVPAFDLATTFPGPLTYDDAAIIQSPDDPVIDRTMPFSTHWRATHGTVEIRFDETFYDVPARRVIRCLYPAMDGHATVPASVLADLLPADPRGSTSVSAGFSIANVAFAENIGPEIYTIVTVANNGFGEAVVIQ